MSNNYLNVGLCGKLAKSVSWSTFAPLDSDSYPLFEQLGPGQLVPLARDRVGRNGMKLEKCQANGFQVIAFLFSKCTTTDLNLLLSRIEFISFLLLF